jgi:hypothetical protein
MTVTPAEFVATYGPYADQVQRDIGMPRWAVLTQWALETGWGTSQLAVGGHNLAGIKHRDPRTGELVFATYSSVSAFVLDYERVMGLSYYDPVRAAFSHGVEATLWALGNSPWDAGRYGNPPGQNLINLWRSSLAPLAGVTTTTTTTAQTWSGLYVAAVQVLEALGASVPDPPWAAAQGLAPLHLGHPPSDADASNYIAGLIYRAATTAAARPSSTPQTITLTPPPTAPAGTTDPTALLRGPYVALVELGTAVNYDVGPVPWAAQQGLTGHHLGTVPDLTVGINWHIGQLNIIRGILTAAPVPPPGPPGPPGAGGGGATTPPPPPPPPGAPGLGGMSDAWSQLGQLITVALPQMTARLQALYAEINRSSGGGTPPKVS